MSMIAERISSETVGKICSQFRFVEGGTLILYFNSSGNDAGTRLWIDCPWRFREPKRVLVGSMDESELVLQMLQGVTGLEVKAFSVDDATGDFKLVFTTNLVVETFGHTTIDEIWELRDKSGLRLGMGPQSKPFERIENPD